MASTKNIGGENSSKGINNLILTVYSRFMPSLNILESVLKNGLYNLIIKELGESWFVNQLNDTNNDQLFKTEISLIKNRKSKSYRMSPESLLIESGLGLWVEFFNPRVYKLAKGVPIKLFTGRPKHIKRAAIYQKLLAIKDFRNQLVHSRLPMTVNEVKNETLDTMQSIYATLVELLEWMEETPVFSLEQVHDEIQVIREIRGASA